MKQWRFGNVDLLTMLLIAAFWQICRSNTPTDYLKWRYSMLFVERSPDVRKSKHLGFKVIVSHFLESWISWLLVSILMEEYAIRVAHSILAILIAISETSYMLWTFSNKIPFLHQKPWIKSPFSEKKMKSTPSILIKSHWTVIFHLLCFIYCPKWWWFIVKKMN